MATIKQCKLLAARCKEVGKAYDFEAFKDLNNGEVDEEIEAIKKWANAAGKSSSPEAKKQPVELNGQRFGMVYKIVIDRVGHPWKLAQQEDFIKEVVAEYQLATKAEEAVKSASSSTKAKAEVN